jgi:hypothetical protein
MKEERRRWIRTRTLTLTTTTLTFSPSLISYPISLQQSRTLSDSLIRFFSFGWADYERNIFIRIEQHKHHISCFSFGHTHEGAPLGSLGSGFLLLLTADSLHGCAASGNGALTITNIGPRWVIAGVLWRWLSVFVYLLKRWIWKKKYWTSLCPS